MQGPSLIVSDEIPDCKYKSYFQSIWTFQSFGSSFFASVGVGLLKVLFESSPESNSSKILLEIDEAIKVLLMKQPEFEIMQHLIHNELIQDIQQLPNRQARLRLLQHKIEQNPELIHCISILARVLFATKSMKNYDFLISDKTTFDQIRARNITLFIESVCTNVLTLNMNDKSIPIYDKKYPLITLYRSDDSEFKLLIPKYEDFMNLSCFPYTFTFYTEKQAETLRILIEALNISQLSQEELNELERYRGELLVNEIDLNNQLRRKVEQINIQTSCGHFHNKEEIIKSIENTSNVCPCGRKLTLKDIDKAKNIVRKKGGVNSIKNQTISLTYTTEEKKQKHKKHRLDCRHSGIDPINCKGHRFCFDCRYKNLKHRFKCHFCDRRFEYEEREKLWKEIEQQFPQGLIVCILCHKISLIKEKNLCLTCGYVSYALSS